MGTLPWIVSKFSKTGGFEAHPEGELEWPDEDWALSEKLQTLGWVALHRTVGEYAVYRCGAQYRLLKDSPHIGLEEIIYVEDAGALMELFARLNYWLLADTFMDRLDHLTEQFESLVRHK